MSLKYYTTYNTANPCAKEPEAPKCKSFGNEICSEIVGENCGEMGDDGMNHEHLGHGESDTHPGGSGEGGETAGEEPFVS
jgi:hypothetical protein